MIRINPEPEATPEVIKPYSNETLQSLLSRKRIVQYRYNMVMYNKAREEEK